VDKVYQSAASQPRVVEVRAGLDYLTATLPSTAPTGSLWVFRCLAVLDTLEEMGYQVQPRTMMGYYGASAGNCFVGERDDGYLLQLTGFHANNHFRDVYRSDMHVSRLDVQMSVKYDVMPHYILMEAYNGATDSNSRLSPARRRKLVRITGSDGGGTLYIGAPSSDQRGRLYNKEIQSQNPDYERTWRYEVVYRNQVATELARYVPAELDARSLWSQSCVATWYSNRGVAIDGIGADKSFVMPLIKTLPSDVEKKLLWLERQVAPTVRYLRELGFGDTLPGILGLSDGLQSSPAARDDPR